MKSEVMNYLKITAILIIANVQQPYAQQRADSNKQIGKIIDNYTQSVIKRDSITFYNLFNDETVIWCAALKDRSQGKEIESKGLQEAGSNYFSSTYKGFMRSLFRYEETEDKFDNIHITEDGTVATVNMDYSFWANGRMTNWGCKYLTLIKKDGNWKIASVLYSLELTEYFKQPSLAQRKKIKS